VFVAIFNVCKTCDQIRRESVILHLDGSGNLFHFDFFQDCVAPGQKAPAQPKTLVFLMRPADGARPAMLEPKPPGQEDEVPMSFWQKVR